MPRRGELVVQMIWTWTEQPATIEEIKGKVGPDWHPIIDRLVDDFFALGWSGVVEQVKEKFGGLRFYTEQSAETFRNALKLRTRSPTARARRVGSGIALRRRMD